MGLDFISKARPAIQKRWSLGREDLACPGLFTADPGSPTRVLAFVPEPNANVKVSTEVVLFAEGDKLFARYEKAAVAVALNPPADVLARVRAAANCALGTVIETHELSGVLDIEVE